MSEHPRDLAPGGGRGAAITFDFEGRPVRAYEGEPVAVALYASGTTTLGRSSKYHRPRGLFCLEGHCNSCYMRIDGRPNLRSCLVPARPGLRCQRQNAVPNAELDVLRAADWLFPHGMDHHTLMTGSRVGNEIFLRLVRQMGGSGTLPDAPPPRLPEVADQTADLCVVGAGPAGLAAARAAAGAAKGAQVIVYDEQGAPGGSLLADPGGAARGRDLAAGAEAAGARLVLGATAIGYYPEDDGGVLAVVTTAGLVRVKARRFLYATGGYDQNLPFPDNDRPGVVSARACGRLAFRFGVRPGERVVLLDPSSLATPLAAALADAGVAAEVVDTRRERVERARGAKRVRGVELRGVGGDGAYRRLAEADVVAVAAVPAPASELPRQHGAAVRMEVDKGGFCVSVDDGFATTAPGVYACGDVTGYLGTARAEEAGAAAGSAAAARLA